MCNLKLIKMEFFEYFKIKYLYLDKETRVRFGFTISKFGITYTLQRKSFFWNTVAWTYPSTHDGENIDSVIEYLKWHEEKNKAKKIKCLF